MQMLSEDVQQEALWSDRRARLADLDPGERADALSRQADSARRDIVRMISRAGQGHIGGDLSVTDALTVLYNVVLNVDPLEPRRDGRDVFVMSKGHCAAALYSTLASCGFFSPNELSSFMEPLSDLNGHPARSKVPGVETSTGPLGHGLPVAVGAALGARIRGTASRVFVITGDGEMQEGSNWEALMSASHFGLDNLTLLVDRNRLQQGARTEETNALDPLDEKLAAFGLEVRVIDGHDFTALEEAFGPSTTGKPVGIVANTVKGKGISFIEDRVEWHHKVPSAEQVELALKELSA
jgi:transketolase